MAKPSFLKGAPIQTKLGGRKSFLALLILFSFFIFAGVVHHHPDGLPHQSCLLCYLILQHSDCLLQTSALISAILVALPYVCADNLAVIPSVSKDLFAIRAPPLR
jgi:hypothetical protein